jgi:hypothetical protein
MKSSSTWLIANDKSSDLASIVVLTIFGVGTVNFLAFFGDAHGENICFCALDEIGEQGASCRILDVTGESSGLAPSLYMEKIKIFIQCQVFSLLLLLGTVFPKMLPRVPTWTSRISSFVKGDETENAADKNYQTDIAKAGIALGGLQGTGPSKSTVKNILPSAWADFIFAIFIEEYGSILGGLTLILLYLIILYRVIVIAKTSKSDFGSYLAFGLGFSIVFQAFLNMGVSVNLLPVTGQPLPMISMGGTSILFTSISVPGNSEIPDLLNESKSRKLTSRVFVSVDAKISS